MLANLNLMSSYPEYRKSYDERMRKYSLPPLDNIQTWFNISDFAYPEHLILWDIAQGISHHYNLLSMIVESLVTGQIRYAALYEMKKMSVAHRKDINNMWGLIQAMLWKLNKINLVTDEAKVARLVNDACGFWQKEYMPFAAKYYPLLERVWTAEETKDAKNQLNYYD